MMNSRLTYAAIAMVMTLGLVATDAVTQGPSVSKTQTEHSDTAGAKDNPCTSETFAYEGKQQVQTQTGQNRTRISVHERGEGVTPTGVRYQTQLWGDITESGPKPPVYSNFSTREHLIRTDPTLANTRDDFFVHSTTICNQDGCRDQPPTPDDRCR